MRGSTRASADAQPQGKRGAVTKFWRLYARSPAALVGLALLILVIAMAMTAGFLFPKNPLGLAGPPLIWPFQDARFPLGTDNSGRDIAAQIFHGARISLLIGLCAMALIKILLIFYFFQFLRFFYNFATLL